VTAGRPGDEPRRFTLAELDDVSEMEPGEATEDLRVARELEGLAARSSVAPATAFADRVMAAVAAEPSPAPARAAGLAVRRLSLGALIVAIRDSWRVAVRPGFPAAARSQALAVLLVVLVAGTASAGATAGALGMLGGDRTGPSPSPAIEAPTPTVETPETATPTPSLESESPTPSESVEPTESADEEASPAERTDPPSTSGGDHGGSTATDDHGGSSGSDHEGSGSDDSKTRTPKPTETPKPTGTPEPEDHSGSHDEG
jgi:hypothetical protein